MITTLRSRAIARASLHTIGARTLMLAALAVATPVLHGCTPNAEAADAAESAPTPVRVRNAAAIERIATVGASGTVDANVTADVAFQVGGKVASVFVEEGQLVRAGQPLAALDPTDYTLSATQASASAIQANDEYARMRRLYERGSLAPNDYQKFETAAHVAAAQAELAAKRVSDARLSSPISGVVARRGIEAGETVGAGAPVFTIVAVDPVTIRVGIPEAQIGQIRKGATAAIAVPARPGEVFRARVTMIGVSADPSSRTYPVKLVVPNPSHILLPGMIAEARIDGDRMTHALTIPGESIVRDADGATLVFVYFPTEKRVYGRRVVVGAPIDREVEILSGLAPEDLVVIAGQHRVRDGAPVDATIDGAGTAPATPPSAREGPTS